MKFDTIATYVADGDAIISEVYLLDDSRDAFVPNLIKTGLAELVDTSTSYVLSSLEFDRRMGNSDGKVKLLFSHPARNRGISLRVSVTLMDDTQYSKTVPVLYEEPENLPLAESPDVLASPDTRQRTRMDEGL